MSKRLPPLNSLRAFEAAGRHLSLTRAAQELHVTPAAVSHQVKALEAYLGVTLFRRANRSLVLTGAGQALLPGLSEGFERLSRAVDALRGHEAGRPLVVSVAPTFGARWLVPRLDRFTQANPGIDVRIDASLRLVDLAREDVDVAVRYGPGDYPGLHVECLLSEEVVAVCSPRLLDSGKPLATPGDLRHHTLLHVAEPAGSNDQPDWRMWLKAAGVSGVDPSRGPSFSQQNLAIQAAVEGQGVVLAGKVLVSDDLAEGRLVRPVALTFPVGFAYYVVCLEAAAEQPRVAAFRRWLQEEARAARGAPPDRGA